MNCNYCHNEMVGELCSNCGRSQILKRIDGTYILSEISSVLNFDKGILFTIKELLFRPGLTIRRFIHEDRARVVRPIIFIIVTSLVYSIAQSLLHFEDSYVTYTDEPESATAIIFKWITSNYGYSNILISVFIALWLKLFFRRYNYNFFEIIILLCFVIGIGMLFYTLFGIIESITGLRVLQLGGFFGIIYTSWAIGRFFDRSKKINYFKALCSYLLGMVTFFSGANGLGSILDAFMQ